MCKNTSSSSRPRLPHKRHFLNLNPISSLSTQHPLFSHHNSMPIQLPPKTCRKFNIDYCTKNGGFGTIISPFFPSNILPKRQALPPPTTPTMPLRRLTWTIWIKDFLPRVWTPLTWASSKTGSPSAGGVSFRETKAVRDHTWKSMGVWFSQIRPIFNRKLAVSVNAKRGWGGRKGWEGVGKIDKQQDVFCEWISKMSVKI